LSITTNRFRRSQLKSTKDRDLEKRRREQTRKQKQQDKQQRRLKRDAERQTNPGMAQDADLAGMVPGPQPDQIISDSASDSPQDSSDKSSDNSSGD